MFLTLTYKDGDFALLKPCARADIGVLEYLLNALREEWMTRGEVADGYDTLSLRALTIIAKIIDLMPRVDALEPVEVEKIAENELVKAFITVIDDSANFKPSHAVALHSFEPLKSTKKIVPIEEEVTVDNVPIPSSGDQDADLLASLMCVTQGDAMSAQLMYESWDAERLDRFIFAFNERQRDPEERKAEYMASLFEQWKSNNQAIINDIRFRKR